MVRAVLGFVAAALLWTVAFLALTFAVAAVWPAYAAHGSTWFESGVFTFEPPMAAPAVLLGGKMAAGFLRRVAPAVAA